MSTRSLEVSNKRIIKFYNENPAINFEAVNIIFIDLFEKLLFDANSTMATTLQSQMLSAINSSATDIHELKQTMLLLKDSVASSKKDIITNIITEFVGIKREYIEDVRTIVQSNTYEKIGPLLEKNNNILIDKTTLIVNDVVPRNQNQYCSQITDSLSAFHKSITDDTQTLMKSVDNQSIKDFINNFELKSSLLLQNVQQPIYSFISASEERINNNINGIKDGAQTINTKIMEELGDLLGKARTSQQVILHDKQLSNVLTKMYNSAEIQTLPALSNSNTLLLKRIRKPNVLIENKNVEQNVCVDDINAFMLMIEEQHCNGIFISQNSGISTKKNYQIEMHNNNIIVFVHNAEYSPTKIEIAVDIIDNLSTKLRQFKAHNEDDCTVPKDVLDTINNEYQLFLSQKNAVVEVFKESQKKVLCQIDEIRFPSLDRFLSTKYSAPIQKPGLKCEMCKSFSANNLKALAAHKRGCARKNTIVLTTHQVAVAVK